VDFVARIMKKLLAAVALAIAVPTTAFAAALPKMAEAPSLPSADRLAPYIKAKLGDTANADIRLCIAADGHVTKIELVKGSTYKAFDNAVMRDVSDWKFESTRVDRCVKTTIAYHVK
jgi:TonB family protein